MVRLSLLADPFNGSALIHASSSHKRHQLLNIALIRLPVLLSQYPAPARPLIFIGLTVIVVRCLALNERHGEEVYRCFSSEKHR